MKAYNSKSCHYSIRKIEKVQENKKEKNKYLIHMKISNFATFSATKKRSNKGVHLKAECYLLKRLVVKSFGEFNFKIHQKIKT